MTIVFLCFVSGVARDKFRFAPYIAAVAIVLAYAGFLIAVGVWAGNCWGCDGETDQGAVVQFVVMAGLGLTVGMLTLIWIGTRVAALLRLLLKLKAADEHAA